MRFLADMGVNQRIVEWLRDQGHETVHLSDEGLQRLTDRDVFAKAAGEHRILLTFDLDFGEIAMLSADQAAGVVIFRLRNARTAHVLDRLGAVLTGFTAELEDGAVVLVVLDNLAAGESHDSIAQAYHITPDDVQAALAYATQPGT